MDEHPFSDLKTVSSEFLDKLQGRSECPNCKRSRKYYCYTCFVPVTQLQGQIPTVKLPLKIDIIKHPSEVDGKSTSAHAKVLAPDDVDIYTYPCIPDYPRDGSVVLVFPGENSCTIEDLGKRSATSSAVSEPLRLEKNRKDSANANTTTNITDEDENKTGNNIQKDDKKNCEEADFKNSKTLNSENKNEKSTEDETSSKVDNPSTKDLTDSLTGNNDLQRGVKRKNECIKGMEKTECLTPAFKKAVFIDSTWNQTSRISTDERLKGLPCVILKNRESKFWRHQKEFPSTYLATIEAIYYLVRDYHDLFISTNYEGEYDNLLFFFVYMYDKIHGLYTDRTLKADSQRKKLKQ